MTIGIDYGVKKVEMKNGNILAINIFDLSGDDDFKIVRKQFYPDSLGVLLAFDVNIKSTFENIGKWEREAENSGLNLSNCVVLLIGNKIDLKKKRVIKYFKIRK